MQELDPSILQGKVLSDQNVWIVVFFVPWCERSRKFQSQFAIAAQVSICTYIHVPTTHTKLIVSSIITLAFFLTVLFLQLLKKTIRFGRFNCDIHVAECIKAGIKQHPTLMVYDSRFRKKKLTDGFQIDGTMAGDIKRNVLDFTARVSRDEL